MTDPCETVAMLSLAIRRAYRATGSQSPVDSAPLSALEPFGLCLKSFDALDKQGIRTVADARAIAAGHELVELEQCGPAMLVELRMVLGFVDAFR